MKKIFSRVAICLFLLFLTLPLSANAGIPVLFLSFPVMLVSLIPVIVIEIFFYQLILKVNWRKLTLGAILANTISTLFGYPLAWGLLLGLQFLFKGGSCGPGAETLSSAVLTAILEVAWLCPPNESAPERWYWVVLAAALLINLVLAYFISILVEYAIIKRFTQFPDKSRLKKAVWKANLVSYLFLPLFAGFYILLRR